MTDAPDAEVVADIERRARELYEKNLDPIAGRFEFESSPSKAETAGLPMVLLLGNHSSGKSSFVNYLVGEDLQRTGIAPIDDGFTIITKGEREDRDGAAIVTDPDLPWSDLQSFGNQLVSHLRLRRIPNANLKDLALIDSPGMIDAADSKVDRGYDFSNVVRWFAERADVILLLFDPDKPGTTGETLKVLTDSLAGLDHKVLLIFNKVDRFTAMRDFARAYGALCWNLSKAIPRKDLPHVYNTFLPVPDVRADNNGSIPLEDFEKSREEVAEEVRRAPYRRLDNIISRLHEYARRLRVHGEVLSQLSWERTRQRLFFAGIGTAIIIFGFISMYAAYSFVDESSRVSWVIGLMVTTLVAVGIDYGVYVWDRKLRERNLSLEALFERTYQRELALGDEAADLRALWKSVKDRVKRALKAQGVGGAPRLRRGDVKKLTKVIDNEVPKLRTKASETLKRVKA